MKGGSNPTGDMCFPTLVGEATIKEIVWQGKTSGEDKIPKERSIRYIFSLSLLFSVFIPLESSRDHYRQ
jgi:hypothetical protein